MSPAAKNMSVLAADTLVLAEVFGPTFQGEGPCLGVRTAFVRLGGCNLHCAWCDTPYTWDASRFDLHKELTRHPVHAVIARITHMNVSHVVITGGEPLLWQGKTAWSRMLRGLYRFARIEVETNGTIMPDEDSLLYVRRFNVSPKLANNKADAYDRRIKRRPLDRFAKLARVDRATLKIVVRTPADVRDAARLANLLEWPAEAAYVMPEGTTAQAVLARSRELADVALSEGINMTTRLHTLLWGQERGR